MNYLNDIWNHILPLIDWVVFLLVIASGYFIRVTPLLENLSTTKKVLIFSLIITIIYTIAAGVDIGVYVASYFLAFGFHSAIIKMIERMFYNPKTNQSIKKDDGAVIPNKGF
jgi:hypothetical protein